MMKISTSQIAIIISSLLIIEEIASLITILMLITSNVDYVMETFTLRYRSKVSDIHILGMHEFLPVSVFVPPPFFS